jgi:hypothetical protein
MMELFVLSRLWVDKFDWEMVVTFTLVFGEDS